MIRLNDIERFEELRLAALGKYKDDKFYNIKSLVNWVRYIRFAMLVAKHIPKNGKVLDVGCGGGEPTALIKMLRPDCEVKGIDILERDTWPVVRDFSVELIKADGENLKQFKGEEFDVVVSFGVIEHVRDEGKFLKETFRVLKKGGYYFVFDLPNKLGFSEFLADIIIKTRHHDRKYTVKGITDMVSKYAQPILVIRENMLPVQLHRLSESAGEFMNRNWFVFSNLEEFLAKTPLNFFAQSITVFCRKR
ncbi:hypothetical protein A3K63_01105 [Candidatus Micrarchaeota archaeon RBG_16_49_10]|nr:MAG: hypothetical protein A3K63_01105 [Candidatus Micrarchaeota archaeon RBG_16_49_10]